MIRESNRIPLCIIVWQFFYGMKNWAFLKTEEFSKAIRVIQRFFLGILTNFLPWKEPLIVKKSKQTRKSQRFSGNPLDVVVFSRLGAQGPKSFFRKIKFNTVCFLTWPSHSVSILKNYWWHVDMARNIITIPHGTVLLQISGQDMTSVNFCVSPKFRSCFDGLIITNTTMSLTAHGPYGPAG